MKHMQRITVTLPRDLARRLRMEAERTGRPVSAVVRDAVHAHLDRGGAPPLPSFVGAGRSGRGDVSERAEELARARLRRRPR
ncbi:MAG TPA: ribbon-helix-helix domain-containing protein [Actinomycetota bacterium]|nr:ribbon-helix-helix domain-containing protein [Actinomycetota bacterium]